MTPQPVLGVVFDKDGTLLDFHATWDPAYETMLRGFAAGDDGVFDALCTELGYDRERRTIRDDSAFVADSNRAFALRVGGVLGWSPDESDPELRIEQALDRLPSRPVAAEGVADLLVALQARGVPMAIATNDSARRARTEMEVLGWERHFTTILGYDSGHGEKPEPGMVLAAAEAMGLRGDQVAMVGDSSTDMGAGRAAGSWVVLVGSRMDLAPTADLVLADIGALVDMI